MIGARLIVCRLLIILALALASLPARAEPLMAAIESIGADVVFLRHALAPGSGDPEGFRIGDCGTQRNLDERGRAQARSIGRYLLDNGIAFDEVLSSQWCRCRDTAEEMGIGEWREFPGLNSFFSGYADREATLALLDRKLEAIKPGERVLMVTHQVVIQAVAGISPPSGGVVVHNSRTGESESVRLPVD